MKTIDFIKLSYSDKLKSEHLSSDRIILWIIFIHMIVAIFITSNYYNMYSVGMIGGISIFLMILLAYFYLRGTLAFRLIAALALMTFSTIYIQQHLGRIEMHFHVFIGLAILTVYKDVIPMLFGAFYIAIHHFFFNFLQANEVYFGSYPIILFNYGCGIEHVYLHVTMVIAEAIVLSYIIFKNSQQYLNMLDAQEKAQKARVVAEQAEKMKTDFLANMSHEIRTPMNGIIGFTHLLKETPLDMQQHHYTQVIESSTNTLLGIVNDILDFSKMNSDNMKLEPTPVNLFLELENTLVIFNATAQKKEIDYKILIDTNLHECLLADDLRLKQILTNLVGNAMKFTYSGGTVKVKIEVKSQSETEQSIYFAVEDSGIGISKERLSMIFDAFTQADSSTTREFGGTGLGLNISASLVRMMGTQLKVDSIEKVGSTFHFTVTLPICKESERLEEMKERETILVCLEDNDCKTPVINQLKRFMINAKECLNKTEVLAELGNAKTIMLDKIELAQKIYDINPELNLIFLKQDQEEVKQLTNMHIISISDDCTSNLYNILAKLKSMKIDTTSTEESYSFNLKVLVAEDYDVNQALIAELLTRYDVDFTIVENGAQAVEEGLNHKYDLVLMDINMPVMSGLEAMRHLRDAYSDTLPIVALTANASEGDKEQLIAEGMDDYLSKPIDTKALENILKKYTKNMD